MTTTEIIAQLETKLETEYQPDYCHLTDEDSTFVNEVKSHLCSLDQRMEDINVAINDYFKANAFNMTQREFLLYIRLKEILDPQRKFN